MLPTKLDHCVIHVTDWERSNAFYTTVLGAELVARPTGYAYRFGDKQLNVHGPGIRPAEVARLPVAPGNSDLCFEWIGPIADAVAHLGRHGGIVQQAPHRLREIPIIDQESCALVLYHLLQSADPARDHRHAASHRSQRRRAQPFHVALVYEHAGCR